MPTSDLLAKFAREFIGLDRHDVVFTLDGQTRQARRVYLDTTATALMPRPVYAALATYFAAASANSHTEAHRGGRDTTQAIEDGRDAIGRLVGYQPERDVVLFTSNGATGAINFLARALFPSEFRLLLKRFPDGAPAALVDGFLRPLDQHGVVTVRELLARPRVVTTAMEHHSNLLPWMEAVGHHNVIAARVVPDTGALDLDDLARILAEHGPKTRLVAVTAVSNVTGIVNPVHEIARMAHEVGAEILVDGAQWVPHAHVVMHPGERVRALDYLVLSGHKLYAPGSRGALIGNLSTLSQKRCVTDVGGGMVEYVSLEEFEIKEQVTAREEAGTPNIPGSIAMGLIAEILLRIGMDRVARAEEKLTDKLLNRLSAVPHVTVYGATNRAQVPRAGVVAFNVEGLHHGLVATYLNDFHNIAVRNACFCAQPYVKALLGVDAATETVYRHEMSCGDLRHIPGMVRASLGIYSTEDDIETLGRALEELVEHRGAIQDLYAAGLDGHFRPRSGARIPTTFRVVDEVDAWAKGY